MTLDELFPTFNYRIKHFHYRSWQSQIMLKSINSVKKKLEWNIRNEMETKMVLSTLFCEFRFFHVFVLESEHDLCDSCKMKLELNFALLFFSPYFIRFYITNAANCIKFPIKWSNLESIQMGKFRLTKIIIPIE